MKVVERPLKESGYLRTQRVNLLIDLLRYTVGVARHSEGFDRARTLYSAADIANVIGGEYRLALRKVHQDKEYRRVTTGMVDQDWISLVAQAGSDSERMTMLRNRILTDANREARAVLSKIDIGVTVKECLEVFRSKDEVELIDLLEPVGEQPIMVAAQVLVMLKDEYGLVQRVGSGKFALTSKGREYVQVSDLLRLHEEGGLV